MSWFKRMRNWFKRDKDKDLEALSKLLKDFGNRLGEFEKERRQAACKHRRRYFIVIPPRTPINESVPPACYTRAMYKEICVDCDKFLFEGGELVWLERKLAYKKRLHLVETIELEERIKDLKDSKGTESQ